MLLYRIKHDPQRTFGGEIKIGGGLLATQSASLEGVLKSVFSRFCPRKWQSKIECSQFSGFSSKNLIWLFNLSQNLYLTPQDFSLPQPKSSSNSVFLQFNWRYEFSQNCFHLDCEVPGKITVRFLRTVRFLAVSIRVSRFLLRCHLRKPCGFSQSKPNLT